MNKRHYEHTLPNIRGSLSNTYKESTARNMKAEGITPLIIQKCTGLSLEEIERL